MPAGRPSAVRSAPTPGIDVEVLAARAVSAPLPAAEVRGLCELVAERFGVRAGHVAVHFVAPARIAELNSEHRAHDGPTDVLSFPIDGLDALTEEAMRELGDVVICPEHTADPREAVVHGMLHLLGMDHELDDGEMLRLQDELLAEVERRV